MGAEMARVCRNLQQRGRAGAKQQIVKDTLVLQSKRTELVRDCEDDM